MSTENGSAFTTSLDAVLVELKAIQKEMQKKEDSARAALNAILAEKKRIDQMVRAAEGTGNYGPRKTKGGRDKSKIVSDENLETYWQRLQGRTFASFGDIPGGFSAKDVEKHLGVHKSTSDRIVRTLREQDRIRLVGQRYPDDNEKHTGRAMAVYVINE